MRKRLHAYRITLSRAGGEQIDSALAYTDSAPLMGVFDMLLRPAQTLVLIDPHAWVPPWSDNPVDEPVDPTLCEFCGIDRDHPVHGS